jgi:hypothetical protein
MPGGGVTGIHLLGGFVRGLAGPVGGQGALAVMAVDHQPLLIVAPGNEIAGVSHGLFS